MKVVGENALEKLIKLIKAKFDTKANKEHTHKAATTSANGFMSSTDKSKLDGIAAGAQVNQKAFSQFKVGTTDIKADTETDILTLVAGSNVTLTPDATNDRITIAAKDTTYSIGTKDTAGITKLYSELGSNADGTMTQEAIGSALAGKAGSLHTHDAATTSENGFMSSTDKTKLDGIQANATAVAFTQSATSGNKVGSITINGTSTDMYSPTQTSVTGNAGTATKWQTARNINGMTVDGTANRTNYGTCSTAADTAAKTVDCTGFKLVTGAEITVKFTVTNKATKPTLNVNGKGARPIFYRGSPIATGYLAAGRVYTFRYDGAHYELVGDVNTDSDTKVSQNLTTVNAEYPLLLGPNGQTTNVTTTTYFDSGVTLNPSTNTIAANISGSAAKVANALTVKANGTQLYTYDGSAAKTINIKAGSNITLTSDNSGNIIINSSSSSSGDAGVIVYEAESGGLYCDGSTYKHLGVNACEIQDPNPNGYYKRFRFYCQGYYGLVCVDMPLDREHPAYIATNGTRYGGVIFPTAENGNINSTGIGPSNHMYYELKWKVTKDSGYWTVQVIDSGWLGLNAGKTTNDDYTGNASTSNAGTGYVSWNQRHNNAYCIYKIVAYTD